MIEALRLLESLEREGFSLRASGGRLLVGPAARLTEARRADVARHRDAILALLRQDQPLDDETAAMAVLAWDDPALMGAGAYALAWERLRATENQGGKR
jgi:hypothetical protein